MSADRWTKCPKCDAVNNEDPTSEFHGTVRVDIDVMWDVFEFQISFWCTECDWMFELTQQDVNV